MIRQKVQRPLASACGTTHDALVPPPPRAGSGAITKVNARGEHVLPVQKRIKANPDGTTSVEASFNLEAAPVPERRYAADTASVMHDGDTVLLAFGQRLLPASPLRSLVIIKVSPETVRKLLASSREAAFAAAIDTFLDRNKIHVPALERLGAAEPPHVVSLVANVVAFGFTGREAVLDFYHFNALALKKLNESSELAIDAVVRVDLSTGLLAAVVRSLATLEAELPPEAT